MRIWDLLPKILCRQHLLGEHRELHALYNRHEKLVQEMTRRGYRHKKSPQKKNSNRCGSPKKHLSIPTAASGNYCRTNGVVVKCDWLTPCRPANR